MNAEKAKMNDELMNTEKAKMNDVATYLEINKAVKRLYVYEGSDVDKKAAM